MTVYVVTSTSGLGTLVSTRHYSADKAEAERGRRQMAGHTAITAQPTTLDPTTLDPTATETCTKRAPLPKGGAHA